MGIAIVQIDDTIYAVCRNEAGYWRVKDVPFEPLQWYHIMMVWIPNTALRLFLNGCLAKETYTFFSIESNMEGIHNSLVLGNSNIPVDQHRFWAEMAMDELKMWDAVMDDNKVWQIFISQF